MLSPALHIPSITQPPSERAEKLFQLLEASAQGGYIGESISQLEHSLQAAHLAAQNKAPNSTITAALLHDIGQFIPLELLKMSKSDETAVGRPNHASSGAVYLASLGFPETVTSLVREHVNAKKYLCAVDGEYYRGLSEASKASLKQQGGPMGERERREWERGTIGWEDCVRVRRWDDAAKVVGIVDETPRCTSYIGIVASCLH